MRRTDGPHAIAAFSFPAILPTSGIQITGGLHVDCLDSAPGGGREPAGGTRQTLGLAELFGFAAEMLGPGAAPHRLPPQGRKGLHVRRLGRFPPNVGAVTVSWGGEPSVQQAARSQNVRCNGPREGVRRRHLSLEGHQPGMVPRLDGMLLHLDRLPPHPLSLPSCLPCLPL
jgi:hypothetical protein